MVGAFVRPSGAQGQGQWHSTCPASMLHTRFCAMFSSWVELCSWHVCEGCTWLGMQRKACCAYRPCVCVSVCAWLGGGLCYKRTCSVTLIESPREPSGLMMVACVCALCDASSAH